MDDGAGVSPAELEAAVRKAFNVVRVEVEDVSGGCGAKFELLVVSPEFEGKALLERHRLVNDAVAGLRSRIHALTLRTWTEQQWKAKAAAPKTES